MSKATMPNYADLRQWTKSCQTGNYVGVYDGKLAGMDMDGGRVADRVRAPRQRHLPQDAGAGPVVRPGAQRVV